MTDRPYRILSLDGGGAWAVLQTMALRNLYGADTRGRTLLNQFDLCTATSGGSIVLMGLVENKTLGEIETIFSDKHERRKIFQRLAWEDKWLRLGALFRFVGLGSRYSSAAKLKALTDLAVNTRAFYLDELEHKLDHRDGRLPDLLITSFDYDRERSASHRSNPRSLAAPQPAVVRPRLHEAVHASSSAPVKFFDQAAVIDGQRFWDGAIGGNNNPALLGVVEAIANGVDRERIQILSIGTGSIRVFAPAPPPGGAVSTLADIRKMAVSVLDDPPDAATFHAHVVLGQRLPQDSGDSVADGRVVRLNPVLRYVKDAKGQLTAIPGVTKAEFARLQKIDMDAANTDEFALVKKFGELWLKDAIPNQAIRSNRSFDCEIGHPFYTSAKARWLQMLPNLG